MSCRIRNLKVGLKTWRPSFSGLKARVKKKGLSPSTPPNGTPLAHSKSIRCARAFPRKERGKDCYNGRSICSGHWEGIWAKNQITELGSVQQLAQNSGDKIPNPAVTQPTNPPITQPTNPPITQPTIPPVTQPSSPPVTQPTDPATTGKERLLWEFETGGWVESPAIGFDGTIYVGSLDKSSMPSMARQGHRNLKREGVYSTPAIGLDGTVYVGSDDNKLYAINGKTGVKLWEFATGGAVRSSPAINSNGMVYFGSWDKSSMPSMARPGSSYGILKREIGWNPPRPSDLMGRAFRSNDKSSMQSMARLGLNYGILKQEAM